MTHCTKKNNGSNELRLLIRNYKDQKMWNDIFEVLKGENNKNYHGDLELNVQQQKDSNFIIRKIS